MPYTPNAQNYTCPNCNGVMVFDASIGKLRCQHCGTVYEEGQAERSIPLGAAPVEAHETEHAKTVEDFLERAPWSVTADGSVNAVVYSCPSCAAEVAADQSTVSTYCPYCGNNMLVQGMATQENIPMSVIPFSVTKEQAEENMRLHFTHKWYLSREFDAQLQHMRGMYIPYHLYNIGVSGRAAYVGYDDVSDGDDHRTRYYYGIRRAGHASFERIPVDGSSKMPDGHMDAIAPFDFDQMRDFSASYAAGYLMEVADEGAEVCRPRAEQRAVRSFKDDLEADARRERSVEGISETIYEEHELSYHGYRSCALPVWMMHCTWGEEQMLFAVNGTTGKCVGDLPVETKRRIATIVGTFVGLLLTAIAVYFLFMARQESGNQMKYGIGAFIIIIVLTLFVDGHFMGQMHTAVEATNASMSYDNQGLVVTERWRSPHRTRSSNKARRQALDQ